MYIHVITHVYDLKYNRYTVYSFRDGPFEAVEDRGRRSIAWPWPQGRQRPSNLQRLAAGGQRLLAEGLREASAVGPRAGRQSLYSCTDHLLTPGGRGRQVRWLGARKSWRFHAYFDAILIERVQIACLFSHEWARKQACSQFSKVDSCLMLLEALFDRQVADLEAGRPYVGAR